MSDRTVTSRAPSVASVAVPPTVDERWEVARGACLGLENQQHVENNLQQLLCILQHELLCVRLNQSTDGDVLHEDIALGLAVGRVADVGFVSRRIVRRVIDFADDQSLEQLGMQFRTILCTLEVLTAFGSNTIDAAVHGEIESQLMERFQGVIWSRPQHKTPETGALGWYRCLYLVGIGWEFYKNFKSTEPRINRILSRSLSLISIGLSLAAPAYGSNPPNLSKTLQELNHVLRAVSREPQKHCEVLFSLQELTHLAIALHRWAPRNDGGFAHENPEEVVKELADMIISTAVAIIQENTVAEIRLPRSDSAEISAGLNRGPPKIGMFHLVFGSIDCAMQLLAVNSSYRNSDTHGEFLERMRKLALGETRVQDNMVLRWQAVSVNLANVEQFIDDIQHAYLVASTNSQTIPRQEFCASYNAHRNCNHITRRVSIASTLIGPRRVLDSLQWNESHFHTEELPTTVRMEKCKIDFKGSDAYKAALSPGCNTAVFLELGKKLTIVDLESLPHATTFYRCRSDREYEDFAITEEHVIMIRREKSSSGKSRYKVHVINHRNKNEDIEFNLSDTSDGNQSFHPECITAHDRNVTINALSQTRTTRIAIGAHRSNASAGLRLFEIQWQGSSTHVQKMIWPDSTMTSSILSEGLKSVDFDITGSTLTCVTASEKIISWWLDDKGLIGGSTFQSPRIHFPNFLEVKSGEQGITSATVFTPDGSQNSYMLCTTWPTKYVPPPSGYIQADWPVIFPVDKEQGKTPDALIHQLDFLGRDLEHQISGTVSPDGRLAAMRDRRGYILLLRLLSDAKGGIAADGDRYVKLDKRLRNKDRASSSSLRFRQTGRGLELCCLDEDGNLLRTKFYDPVQTSTSACSEKAPSSSKNSHRLFGRRSKK